MSSIATRLGRPPQLSSEAILAAASEFDMEELTMPALAARLGVTHGALYNYFPSKSDLLASLVASRGDRVAVPDWNGQSWQEWVFEAATSLLALARQITDAGDRVPLELGGHRLGVALTEVLLGAGFSRDEVVDLQFRLQSMAFGTAMFLRRRERFGDAGVDRGQDLAVALGVSEELLDVQATAFRLDLEEAYRRAVKDLLAAAMQPPPA